ncbi:hypothetical protein HYX14_02045 [Candidatus Woesearchaeota archaeon]|nr:hypothetical protein [Candidatus Woesearchaeota archaeon]
MKPFWRKVEHHNASLIPYALAVLVVIVLELFAPQRPWLHSLLTVLDGLIVAVFAVDLIFLAIHARNAKFFFEHYWLDLLAVIPLNLIFRVTSQFYRSLAITKVSPSAKASSTRQSKRSAWRKRENFCVLAVSAFGRCVSLPNPGRITVNL